MKIKIILFLIIIFFVGCRQEKHVCLDKKYCLVNIIRHDFGILVRDVYAFDDLELCKTSALGLKMRDSEVFICEEIK